MKIEGGTMLQDSRIPQKLLKIFTFVILINPDLANPHHTNMGGKRVDNSEFFSSICLRDLAS